MGSIVNISETPAQLGPHRQDRWANREPQAAPTTRRPLWNLSTGRCSPAYSAVDWWAALGPPAPAQGGTGRLWAVAEKSPRPAEQRQVTDACSSRPHVLTVGPAPGTVSVGDIMTDLDRHCPHPAQPPPHRQSPANSWQPSPPCISKTGFPGGTHSPPHSPQGRVPTESLMPARSPQANHTPATIPHWWVYRWTDAEPQAEGTQYRAPLLSGASPSYRGRASRGSDPTGSPGWGVSRAKVGGGAQGGWDPVSRSAWKVPPTWGPRLRGRGQAPSPSDVYPHLPPRAPRSLPTWDLGVGGP